MRTFLRKCWKELKTKTDLPIFPTVAELKDGTPEMIAELRALIDQENDKIKSW